MAYAVKDGFGSSIPAGRFPVFVLHLEVSGDLIDVNVHPQKREVRLRQEQLIKELIIKAVRTASDKALLLLLLHPIPMPMKVSPIRYLRKLSIPKIEATIRISRKHGSSSRRLRQRR